MKRWLFVLVGVLWMVSGAPIWANSPVLEGQELGVFLDTLLDNQLKRDRIVGAAVAVVKDGEVILTTGQGFADLERQRPVDPDSTLFRVGSVSKLFTWTAVMGLVEEGKIDLHANVNDYLDFQIPDTYLEPVTMWHLMTHTAGFEDNVAGMLRQTDEDLVSLAEYLVKHMPARIFPPGQYTAYSNYGTALAGYVVERIRGVPYETVISERVFAPLGMNSTTLQQPVPPALKPRLSKEYTLSGAEFKEGPFEIMQVVPAGVASATVTDMAKFMIAHLGKGSLLEAPTLEAMQQIQFRNDFRLTGMAHGFYQTRVNGHLLLTHAGETARFVSQLYLFPEEDLGVFVVYNTPSGALARNELIQALFDRYYPSSTPETLPQTDLRVPAEIAGSYLPTRVSDTWPENLRRLFDPLYQPVSLTVTTDGQVLSDHPFLRSRNPGIYVAKQWVETEPGYFLQENGNDRMVLRYEDDGHTMMFFDSGAPQSFRKLTTFEQLLHNPVLPALIALGLLVLLISALASRQAPSIVRLFALGVSITGLLFFASMVIFVLKDFIVYVSGTVPLSLKVQPAILGVMGLMSVALTIVTLIGKGEWSILGRLPFYFGIVLSLLFMGWAWFWKLFYLI